MEIDERNTLARLLKIFLEFSSERRPDADSQICLMWSGVPDVLEGTPPLEAINLEFGIEVDEADVIEMFDLSVRKAAKYLEDHYEFPEVIASNLLEDMSGKFALRVLQEVWEMDSVARIKISDAVSNLRWKDEQPK